MPSWCYPPAERLVGQPVLFGDGGGVGEPVSGPSGDLVCPHGRIFRDDGAGQADGGRPSDASSSTNVTHTHSRPSSMILSSTLVPRNTASCSVVDVKISFMTMMLLAVARSRTS